MNQVKLGRLISIVLGPQTWLPALIILEVIRTNLTSKQIEIIFPLLGVFQFLIPAIYLISLIKRKKITAWDMPKREERYVFLAVTFSCYFISLVLVKLLGNQLLFNLDILIIALMVVLFLTSRFWKISLHAGLNTAGSILINFLFGWQLPWLYLAIPVICWARFTLKRHDLFQLLAGVVVSSSILIAGLEWFGYLY